MNRLTSVPTNIAPIIAMESGFCSSEPMSNENSSGTMANIVVSDVMMMGRSLLRPASWMASSNGIPALRNSLMASSFKMESLMMIPDMLLMNVASI